MSDEVEVSCGAVVELAEIEVLEKRSSGCRYTRAHSAVFVSRVARPHWDERMNTKIVGRASLLTKRLPVVDDGTTRPNND